MAGVGAFLLAAPAQSRSRSAVIGWLEVPYGTDPYEENWESYGSSEEEWYIGAIPDAPYDVPLVDLGRIDPRYHRQLVEYNGGGAPGSIRIDTRARFLYLIQADQTALRYRIGVGREGFAWTGTAEVKRKAKWPSWRPPAAMLRRRPDLPRFMEGGPANPLGARALYLYQGNRDTLFRIHGTNEPSTIGQAVSSGCIRMLNEDVYDLYERVRLGTVVRV